MNTSREAVTGLLYGIAAGLSYGISAILIRRGVEGIAPPMVGATISMFAGTLGLLVLGGGGIKESLSAGGG